ncbi:hypothetical protein NHF50_01015 [Flavobacterium sp. NRK F10]|uniref:hypothetical protein n=1 Tax=Flavobacterium sp. NRK F10 TaxID=2954931 RepID=UPI0020901021|nr:hypothetical protein [Flavobacterium sp. NRK F10]MCO6173616.1 hypothetical protein [Flavobacterium sp. NRK F10]
MKGYLLFAFLLVCGTGFSQDELSKDEQERREKNIEAGNPFARFGYKDKVATLSKGKYLEFHDLDSIVTIGSVRFNVYKNQIVGHIVQDTLNPDAQPIGDVIGRWMSPDPLSEEFPEWSPYTMVMDNPLRFNDPTGMAADDVITLNSKGIVTKVERDDRPNIFLDEKGNTLDIHDAEDLDSPLLSKKFEIGDKVFEKISNDDLNKAMADAGSIPYDKDANFLEKGWFNLKYAKASYYEYDFGHSYLKGKLGVSTEQMGELYYGTGYVDEVPFVKFESSNTLFNLPDAGNFMWGHRAFLNNLPKDIMLDAANKNEGGADTNADTRAILSGYNYKTKK